MLTDILVVTMAFHHYIICYSVQFLNCFIIMMKLIMIPASKNISWFLFLFLFYLNGASLQSSNGPIFHIRPNESCGHGTQWSPSTRLEQVPEKPDPKKRYTLYVYVCDNNRIFSNELQQIKFRHKTQTATSFQGIFNIFEIRHKDCLSRPHLQIL